MNKHPKIEYEKDIAELLTKYGFHHGLFMGVREEAFSVAIMGKHKTLVGSLEHIFRHQPGLLMIILQATQNPLQEFLEKKYSDKEIQEMINKLMRQGQEA